MGLSFQEVAESEARSVAAVRQERVRAERILITNGA
jgi:hypothetical protein